MVKSDAFFNMQGFQIISEGVAILYTLESLVFVSPCLSRHEILSVSYLCPSEKGKLFRINLFEWPFALAHEWLFQSFPFFLLMLVIYKSYVLF